jgi:hypothetical protein
MAAMIGTLQSMDTGCWAVGSPLSGGSVGDRCPASVGQSLTPASITQEVKYLGNAGRTTFERPYGIAWLLQLAAELNEWDDPDARQ